MTKKTILSELILMEITDILNELDIAIEGLQEDIGKTAKVISKDMNKKIAEANKAVKKGDFTKASAICKDCISKLENLKSQLQDVKRGTSMNSVNDLVKGNLGDIVADNQIATLKSLIKPMLLLLAAIAVAVGINKPANKKIDKEVQDIQRAEDDKLIAKHYRITGNKDRDKSFVPEIEPEDDSVDAQIDAFHKNRARERKYEEEADAMIDDANARINASRANIKNIRKKNTPFAIVGDLVVGAGVANAIYQSYKQQIAYTRNTLNFKNMNIAELIKFIDVQINSFKAIQKICNSVGRDGRASEAMIDYLTISMEAICDESGSLFGTLVECGYEDELIATIYV